MAFVKKTWKDRIVQYANRRLLTKSGGEVEQVTVTRDEGTISEAGDQFNASNMNDLENRLKNAFDDVDTALSDKADTSDIPTVNDFIKVRKVSTTTNSNGFVNITFTNKVVILSAWANLGDVLIIPFASVNANEHGQNIWWFRVHNDTMQIRANFNFDIYMAYIDNN